MDTPPPDGVPRRPIPPRPIPSRPKRDYAAEEEAARQLTAAHIQLRRGLTSEAEASVHAILALRPTDAGAYELLGDIQETRGDWAAALAAYQAALTHDPSRSTAEAKIGKGVLRQAEQGRRETMGVAYAATDTSLMRKASGESSGWMIIVGTAVCPGLGQIVQGQTVKGSILVGIFLLGVILLTQLPHGEQATSYFSPAFWFITAFLAGDWLYAVADVAATSSRSGNS